MRSGVTLRSLLTILSLSLLLPSVAAAAEDPRVVEIRREYERIRAALPGAKLESIELAGYSADGGAARALRDASGRFVYLRVELLGESGKVFVEHFYGGGRLRFALRQTFRYNVPYYLTPELAKEDGGEPFDARKTTVVEDRLYFAEGRLLRWVKGQDDPMDPEHPEFAAAEKSILAFSDEVARRFPAVKAGAGASGARR